MSDIPPTNTARATPAAIAADRKVLRVKTYADAAIAKARKESRDGLFAPQSDALRRKLGPRATLNFARCRINEIQRLIEHRHGVIPATDDADHYVWLVAQHFRKLDDLNVLDQLTRWCSRWAPEMPSDEIAEIAAHALRKSYRFTADGLGAKLRLTDKERSDLQITTTGAIDRLKPQRDIDRAQKKRRRDKRNAEGKRRRKGALPRAAYEAKSLAQTKPWIAEGVCRRTWERHRQREAQQPPEGWRDFTFERKAA